MAVQRSAYGRAPFLGPMTSAQEEDFRRECVRPDGFVEVHPLPGESIAHAITRTGKMIDAAKARASADLAKVVDLIEVNGVWMTPEDARRG